MPTTIIPKIGDAVAFVQSEGAEPWPAVVTAIEANGNLSLNVTKPNGDVLPKEHVTSGPTGRRWQPV